MEKPYDLLKKFYKIQIKEKTIVPIGETSIGDRSIEDSSISNVFSSKDEIYCPKCGDSRKYEFKMQFDNSNNVGNHFPIPGNTLQNILDKCKEDFEGDDYEEFEEYVYKAIVLKRGRIFITGKCLQCDNDVNIIIYNENNKPAMVKLFRCGSGVSTKHTPENVKYYLDEAYKCKTMGAYTASVAMYRTALENLLYDNEYTQNSLDKKIKALEEDKLAGNAKPWAIYIQGGILNKIKLLGNSAVHPNKGNIGAQQHLKDEELLRCIDEVFKYMLDRIYEDEHAQNSLLAKLEETNNNIRNK